MTLEATPLPQTRKMLRQKNPQKNELSRGSVEGKYWGLLNAKGRRRGKCESDCFPYMESTVHQHMAMIFSRIAWTSFPFLPRTVFFSPPWGTRGGGAGEEMERDTVMIGTVMDAKSN